jgi:hypothetical protein
LTGLASPVVLHAPFTFGKTAASRCRRPEGAAGDQNPANNPSHHALLPLRWNRSASPGIDDPEHAAFGSASPDQSHPAASKPSLDQATKRPSSWNIRVLVGGHAAAARIRGHTVRRSRTNQFCINFPAARHCQASTAHIAPHGVPRHRPAEGFTLLRRTFGRRSNPRRAWASPWPDATIARATFVQYDRPLRKPLLPELPIAAEGVTRSARCCFNTGTTVDTGPLGVRELVITYQRQQTCGPPFVFKADQ